MKITLEQRVVNSSDELKLIPSEVTEDSNIVVMFDASCDFYSRKMWFERPEFTLDHDNINYHFGNLNVNIDMGCVTDIIIMDNITEDNMEFIGTMIDTVTESIVVDRINYCGSNGFDLLVSIMGKIEGLEFTIKGE